MERAAGRATWVPLAPFALFLVLTGLVLAGATQSVDAEVLQRLRPDDAWGEAQMRLAPWMSRLRPQHMYVLLGATASVVSLWRRSWWPLGFASALAVASAVATVAAKLLGQRVDPHGFVAESGGAYPSGHTVALIVCLGGCLLVVWPSVPWWLWLAVGAAATLLAASLLVAGAHWLTDVLGGAFLGIAVLAVSSRRPLRHRAHAGTAPGAAPGRPRRSP